MGRRRLWATASLPLLLSIPTLARAQASDDSREKSEKASEIIARQPGHP